MGIAKKPKGKPINPQHLLRNMNQNTWTVRRAKAEDASGLTNCMVSAYSEYSKLLKGIRLPPMDVDYLHEITSFPVWVAECNDTIIGGLVIMFEDGFATIANIAVHPDFQGKGLGRGLMEFAEAEARLHGYSELRLGTHVLLTQNVSFYSKLGWIEIERDDTRVYMKKNLDT